MKLLIKYDRASGNLLTFPQFLTTAINGFIFISKFDKIKPPENGYTNYLSQSGGSSNASTYPLMTKYYCYVAPDKLEGALDRFTQFFIAPLFTPSATERESNAVNSEHEKNLSNNVWRIKQIQRHLAKCGHAYKKFGSGNKITLYDIPKSKNIDVRKELLSFHKKWYSANIMSLIDLS